MKTILLATGNVLIKPRYALIALFFSLIVLGILIWIFHLPELFYVITLANYPASEKLAFLLSGYQNTLLFIYEPLIFSRVVFSLLAGINIALYVFIRQHESALKDRRGLGGFVAAIIGSGCVACGTSLFYPVLGGSAGFAAASYSSSIGLLGYVIGIILALYSLQGFGSRAASELTGERTIKGKEGLV